VNNKRQHHIRGVFFDLDGTLLDTAPDLFRALNHAMQRHGFPPVDKDEIRPYISYGASAMVRKSLNGSYSAVMENRIVHTMLEHYQQHVAERSQLYEGMAEVLDTLEKRNIIWGVVTNKRKRFAEPLLDSLKLSERAGCIVSGDSAAAAKPHPDPVLLACRQTGIDPTECLFVGDSVHDVAAGKAAGATTLVAGYGYLNPDDDPVLWGSDGLIAEPREILPWLN
jgi:2-phosphoglycolate phosphatase